MLKQYLLPLGIALGCSLSGQVLTVADGGTLTVMPQQTVTVQSGDIHLGNGGVLELNGTLEGDGNMDLVGQLNLSITGTQAGTDFGEIVLGGELDLSSGSLQAEAVSPYAPTETTLYAFAVSTGGLTGPFANLNLPGPEWRVEDGASSATLVFENAKLPVEWLTFAGHARPNNTVDLEWKTAQEDGSDYFAVERLAPDGTWIGIGEVAAAGTSRKVSAYTFHDDNPGSNTAAAYRVRQVDIDGEFDYSAVITVKLVGQDDELAVWPNPASGSLNVSRLGSPAESATYFLWSADGRLLLQGTLPLSGRIELPNRVVTGIYLLRVSTPDKQREIRVLISR